MNLRVCNITIGEFTFHIESEEEILTKCQITGFKGFGKKHPLYKPEVVGGSRVLYNAVQALEEYLCQGKPIPQFERNLRGTDFQIKVWREVEKIPYGTKTTYSEIAEKIGCSASYRAVSNAVGQNPLHIFIPCHRVIGKSGELCGFSAPGKLITKEYLLELEEKNGKYKI